MKNKNKIYYIVMRAEQIAQIGSGAKEEFKEVEIARFKKRKAAEKLAKYLDKYCWIAEVVYYVSEDEKDYYERKHNLHY